MDRALATRGAFLAVELIFVVIFVVIAVRAINGQSLPNVELSTLPIWDSSSVTARLAILSRLHLRSLHEHEELIDAIADGRADDADAAARAHVGIDLENISTALRRAGVLAD